jgi:hypothetical protein
LYGASQLRSCLLLGLGCILRGFNCWAVLACGHYPNSALDESPPFRHGDLRNSASLPCELAGLVRSSLTRSRGEVAIGCLQRLWVGSLERWRQFLDCGQVIVVQPAIEHGDSIGGMLVNEPHSRSADWMKRSTLPQAVGSSDSRLKPKGLQRRTKRFGAESRPIAGQDGFGFNAQRCQPSMCLAPGNRSRVPRGRSSFPFGS